MSDDSGGGIGGCIWLIIVIAIAFAFGPEVFDVAWNFMEAEVGLESYTLLWFLSFVAAWAATVAVSKVIVGMILLALGVGGVGVMAALEFFNRE